MSDSITVVPVNHNQNDVVTAQKIIEHSLIEVICVSKHTLPSILTMLNNDGLPKLNTIICFDDLSDEDIDNLVPKSRQLTIQVLLFK